MVIAGIHVTQDSPTDVQYVATLVVLMVGVLVTNILGFLHFRRQERSLEARVAALDMDTPYLACKHAAQIVRGEPCVDWELLRLRNSVWRSLVLAMLTFVLAARITFEIPVCRVISTLSEYAVQSYPHLANQSLWVHDLVRDGVDYRELPPVHPVDALQPAARVRALPLAIDALRVEHEYWRAAHCHELKWETWINLGLLCHLTRTCLLHFVGFISSQYTSTLGKLNIGNDHAAHIPSVPAELGHGLSCGPQHGWQAGRHWLRQPVSNELCDF